MWDLTLTATEFAAQEEKIFPPLELLMAFNWSVAVPHTTRNSSGTAVAFASEVIQQSTVGNAHGVTYGSNGLPLVYFPHDECWSIAALSIGGKVVESDLLFPSDFVQQAAAALAGAGVGLLVPATATLPVTFLVSLAGSVVSGLLLADGNDEVGDILPQSLVYQEAQMGGVCPPNPAALTQLPNISTTNPPFGWVPVIRNPASTTPTVTAWLRTTGCYMCDSARRVGGICRGPGFVTLPFDCTGPTPTPTPVTSLSPDQRTSMMVEPLREAIETSRKITVEEGNPGGLSELRIAKLREAHEETALGLADFLAAVAIQANLSMVGVEDAVDALQGARDALALGDLASAMDDYEAAIRAAVEASHAGEVGPQLDAFDVTVQPASMSVPAGRRYPGLGYGFGLPDTQVVISARAIPDGRGVSAEPMIFEDSAFGFDVEISEDAELGDHSLVVEMARSCIGSCGGAGGVTIANLIVGVNIALGLAGVSDCRSLDANRDDRVSIAELIAAVRASLRGCFVSPGEVVRRSLSVFVPRGPDTPAVSPSPTNAATPTQTPLPSSLEVEISTGRGCGSGATFFPGESTDVAVEIGGTPAGREVNVAIGARIERNGSSQTVPLFDFSSTVGSREVRRVTYEPSDANSTIILFARVEADSLEVEAQCSTTVGSGDPCSGFQGAQCLAAGCAALCPSGVEVVPCVLGPGGCQCSGACPTATPVPEPTPSSGCGPGAFCSRDFLGRECLLECPFGPPRVGTCQSTGGGCNCFGSCLGAEF